VTVDSSTSQTYTFDKNARRKTRTPGRRSTSDRSGHARSAVFETWLIRSFVRSERKIRNLYVRFAEATDNERAKGLRKRYSHVLLVSSGMLWYKGRSAANAKQPAQSAVNHAETALNGKSVKHASGKPVTKNVRVRSSILYRRMMWILGFPVTQRRLVKRPVVRLFNINLIRNLNL
jgi:hypothetical protein